MTQAFNLSQLANKVNTSGQLDAATGLSGLTPVANGGTNSSATPTAGGAVYGTGTAMGTTAAGTAGQLLQSNGESAPTWVAPPVGGFSNMVVLTSSNAAYSIPANKIKVTVVGGGGNGGSGTTTGSGLTQNNFSNGGGGGGGTSIEVISGLTIGSTVSVTVGGAAGTSSFGAYLSATGGLSASNTAGSIAGAAGGLGANGQLNIQGGSGGNGGGAPLSSTVPGGAGGASTLGGSAKGGSGSAGTAGGVYGGGGGGGSGSGNAGGAGALGVVIIEY